MLEAYKKWILVTYLADGAVRTVSHLTTSEH
jgi:hypothetical protein